MTRLLLTGAAGLLGRAIVASTPPGVELHATWRSARPPAGVAATRVDLADAGAVRDLVRDVRPDVVVHAAYAGNERDIVAATGAVAAAAVEAGAAIVHVSTDAVFGGEDGPYQEDDPPDPCHAYGRWKAAAEAIVRDLLPDAAIVRTSLLCATTPLDPRSAWVADALRDGVPVTLYVDELRQPIAVDDLAAMLWDVVRLDRRERAGPWHLVGPEALSRYALGLLVARYAGVDPLGITAAASPRDAAEPRPRDVRLVSWRADAVLQTRPRPVSVLFAPPAAVPGAPPPARRPRPAPG